jgi:UDP-2-acetamido-2,6-beta-L-arabino-hexul-4-ose reductase
MGGREMTVLVTGARGFLGRNLCAALSRTSAGVLAHDLDSPPGFVESAVPRADIIYHLAGVNRPERVEEFEIGNAGATRDLCSLLRAAGRTPRIILSSSIQAALANPYGQSKRHAEQALQRFCEDTGAEGVIYRLKNLFGKWGRPDYNSVTATFCHRVARDLPLEISDPARELDLTYVDDVVAAFLAELPSPLSPGCHVADPLPSYRVTLGDLARRIESFRESRATLLAPDFTDPLNRCLYATYLAYLEEDDFAYPLDRKSDGRGALAEFVKSPPFGQLFVSRTRPGVTRGNHYHDTKTEKFLVVEGEGIIRFRRLGTEEVLEYPVSGREFRVVDIPPGYTHSIENVGDGEMVTLFWACEVFDPGRADTHFEPVLRAPEDVATAAAGREVSRP